MAANRFGRILYLDAPGTYSNLLEPDTAFTIAYAHVYTDGVHDARLTVYAATSPDPAKLIFDSGVIPAKDYQCDWSRGHTESMVPDSNSGCSAILSGEGARAFIYGA